MTHDELLKKIQSDYEENKHFRDQPKWKPFSALRAVVELHKPDKEGLCAMNCVEVDDDGYAWTQQRYPCQTIKAIGKELQ
jgi:hypothetical protein